MMNTLERFHIHNEKRLDNQINDKCTVKYNPIFNTVIHINSYIGHSLLLSPVDLAQSQTVTPTACT
jgi:hypothetical protein